MRYSIIIPAFNEADRLAGTIHRIRESAKCLGEEGADLEIVVCDNCSTDETARIAESCGVNCVFEPINQISRARNTGARAAKGEWLVFIDADTWPSSGLFRQMKSQIESNVVIGGGALIRLDSDRFMARVAESVWTLISLTTQWAAGSFFFCSSESFRQVGGFSEDLFASEEIDLSIKLKKTAGLLKKEFRILRGHPVITSSRKLNLYSPREMARFAVKWMRSPKRVLRERESCFFWYDGRR